jgi:biotin carboxyl carrier protein
MKFELEVGDRIRIVEVERRVGGYQITVDGRAYLVDATHVSAADWSLLVSAADGSHRRSVRASVTPQRGNGGAFDVHVNGVYVPVVTKGGSGRRAKETGAAGRGSGPQRVNAPMPGKVVRVLVKPGESVKARQGLVVVEAMKMENELRAARDGTVRDVFVVEGQSVDAGAALVLVE